MLFSDLILTVALQVDVSMPPNYRELTILTREFKLQSWDLNLVLCEASVCILATAPSLIVVEGKDDIIDRALCMLL